MDVHAPQRRTDDTVSAVDRVSAESARRLLLQGAGLLEPTERPATPDVIHDVVDLLGYVQLDTIAKVMRAHDHIMKTRISAYTEGDLLRMIPRHRRLFEHWTHDASVIPTACMPAWRTRMRREREQLPESRWWAKTLGDHADHVIDDVLRAIDDRGEVRSRDFTRDPDDPRGSWWGWKPHKAALEYLWRAGTLTISHRAGFEKVFTRMESAYPAFERIPAWSHEEMTTWTCRAAIDRLSVGTAREIAAFHGLVTVREARTWCEHAVETGELERVDLDHAHDDRTTAGYAIADWRVRAELLPPAPDGLRLLSPFDPLIRERSRTQRVFGFDYRFEAFVPAKTRTFGYYVLPILDGDRLIGRVDAERQAPSGTGDAPTLYCRNVWWEAGIRRPGRRRANALDAAGAALFAVPSTPVHAET